MSLLKPLHAGWITEFYNQMTSEAARKVIESGWVSAGIRDCIRLGVNGLPPIDPFQDLVPMMQTNENTPYMPESICKLNDDSKKIAHSREQLEESDDNDFWGPPDDDRNIFNIFDENFIAIE